MQNQQCHGDLSLVRVQVNLVHMKGSRVTHPRVELHESQEQVEHGQRRTSFPHAFPSPILERGESSIAGWKGLRKLGLLKMGALLCQGGSFTIKVGTFIHLELD